MFSEFSVFPALLAFFLTTKSTTATVTKLAQGGAYAFAVKAYKKVDGKNYYSSFTNVVKIVTVPNKVEKIKVSNVKDTTLKLQNAWQRKLKATLTLATT